ncbi:hypothetical protein U0070_002937, partial [Myodes glareolus]
VQCHKGVQDLNDTRSKESKKNSACLPDGRKESIPEKGKETMKELMGQTTDKDCHYALHYITYEAKKSTKEDIGFIFWDPESEPPKRKII